MSSWGSSIVNAAKKRLKIKFGQLQLSEVRWVVE